MKFQTKLIHAVVLGALGVATSAHAVNLGDDGLGEVLLYPYYTTQAGNDTLITLVNTTNNGKAVKVRVRESLNSREVIDFHLYLSAKDAWSAVITADTTTGGAKLKTFDKSCTVPQLTTANADGSREVSFRNFAYTAPTADNGPTGLARTKEGYIEVIEMGTINSAFALTPSVTFGQAVTHVAGVPGNCAALTAAWVTGGAFAAGGSLGVTANSGGLMGTASIINVAAGTDYSYDPVAIQNFNNDVAGNHRGPSDLNPTLGDVDIAGAAPSTVFYPGVPGGVVTVDDWTQAGAGSQAIDAVSAVLMRQRVLNEFTVNTAIGAGTDMVMTFPTRWAYVTNAVATRPFTEPFVAARGVATGACEPVSMSIVGREEEVPGGQIDFSPKPVTAGNALCWESNVVTLSGSNVLASANALNVVSPYADGWMTFTFEDPGHVMTVGGTAAVAPATFDSYNGLPVIGFAVQKYVNGNQGGVLSNYGGAFAHKYVRTIN